MSEAFQPESILVMDLPQLINAINTEYTKLNPADKVSFQAIVVSRSEQLGCKTSVNKLFKTINDKEKALAIKKKSESFPAGINLKLDDKGIPMNIIENYCEVMRHDERYAGINFNVLTGCAEVHSDSGMAKWDNADISKSRNYIEQRYGIYSKDKHRDALNILFAEREYNPILNIIESLTWDGQERIEQFLTKYGKCDDSPYTREVSRLIFACGMWRLMLPGCKVDDVPVLVGKQGGGKSSLVRFLAINDSFFGEVKTTDGDAKSIEQLTGKWICEIPELSAFTKAKEVESVKAFITRQRDMYRTPYAELVEDRPRRCTFIGTTNNPNFLVDLSGNRRYYPVITHCDGYDLYDHETEIRKYILDCWAEAYAKYNLGQLPNYARRDLVEEYQRQQDNAMQDDWRIGAIESYLKGKSIGDKTCVKQIMTDVLSPDSEHPLNPTPRDSKDIGIIMSKQSDWVKLDKPYRSAWGSQRGWERVDGKVEVPIVEIPDCEGLPF